MEADLLQKAIERSLLDFALQLRHVGRGEPSPHASDPHEVLGLREREAESVAAIRAAYRKRALETHPDRGGSPGAFLQVQHAYQRLTEALNPMPTPSSQRQQQQQQHDGSLENDHHERRAALTQRVDVELREHRALVEEWFARDGEDLLGRAGGEHLGVVDALEPGVRGSDRGGEKSRGGEGGRRETRASIRQG